MIGRRDTETTRWVEICKACGEKSHSVTCSCCGKVLASAGPALPARWPCCSPVGFCTECATGKGHYGGRVSRYDPPWGHGNHPEIFWPYVIPIPVGTVRDIHADGRKEYWAESDGINGGCVL